MKWLIENLNDRGSNELILELSRRKADFHVLKDFNDVLDLDLPNNVLFHGSIKLARQLKVRYEYPIYPVVWLTEKDYCCHNYFDRFDDILLNREGVLTTIGQLYSNKWFYWKGFGKEAKIFVRPNAGDKLFTGFCLDLQDLETWYNQFKEKRQELVYVASPKELIGEWRFVVSEKQDIVAQSCYMFQGLKTDVPSAPEGAIKLCKEVLKRGYYPDPMFTIDICLTKDNEYKLLELNSFCTAGLYACNKQKIVDYAMNLILKG